MGELASGEAAEKVEQVKEVKEAAQEAEEPAVPSIGEEDTEQLSAESLFDPAATSRIVFLWVLTPSLSVVGSYLLFALVL